ncbi:NYN domain-containing protein [Massilia sp. ZL223]|uniref:NYN domain-containing protein n=1 Tax=Massilia sp. ZL223 TaxID=2824904 RepID=UPI001B820FF3|nr:NYN domain-containing protein [Massilia sp. ZL223]MBQ5962424.1 NYN domain-containing protein [Massilia sp. ZL223]
MASSSDNISMAVFCDFENVALGVRDANYEKFDIKPVLERLLLKGSIVVKKAYCDWDRYKGFKSTMHEANFELIEIPHVRQSGKNSADIRLVVDALDLCYTKSHVNTFVIISGDSDFSPLVSKLRENAKQVIGVGVKQSTSDLLVANCDEFIFYDDLVREQRRTAAKRKEEQDARRGQPQNKRPSDDRRKEELEARKVQALEMVVETFDALVTERGDTGKIWASLLKDTLKRRRPDFNETYYGFRTFGNLLEEAQTRGLFEFGRDEKSGTYVYRSAHAPVLVPAAEPAIEAPLAEQAFQAEADVAALEAPQEEPVRESRRRGRGGRKQGGRGEQAAPVLEAGLPDADNAVPPLAPEPALESAADAVPEAAPLEIPAAEPAPAPAKERRRAPRKTAAQKAAEAAAAASVAEPVAEQPAPDSAPAEPAEPAAEPAVTGTEEGEDEAGKPARKKSARPAHKAPARKPAARGRRPAKPKTGSENG